MLRHWVRHFKRVKWQVSDLAQPGFTIIELLVVIAIIAVLVAMSLPMLGDAQATARAVKCSSQLRQIGVAWHLFLGDHDDTFPRWQGNLQWFYGGLHPSAWNPAGATLQYRPLNPYVSRRLVNEKEAPLFRCPDDRNIPGVTRQYTAYEYFGNDYLMNAALLYISRDDPQTPTIWEFESLQLVDVSIPYSQLILAGDAQWYYSINDARWDAHFHNNQDVMNVLFLDGHVTYQQIKRGQVVTNAYSAIPQRVILIEEKDGGQG